MNSHILLVSSDSNFYQGTSVSVSLLRQYVDDILVGDPSPDTLKTVQEIIVQKHIRGIVTRGSWISFLKKHLDIPIFPLKIDASDVYNSINHLSNHSYRCIGIAIYSYAAEEPAISTGIDTYTFGDIKLCISHANSTNEIEYVIDRMYSVYKTEYIVGDVEAVRIAQKRGIPTSVMNIGYRFLRDSIRQAQYVIQLSEVERIQNEYVKTIANVVSEAILSFDDDGKLIAYNASAMTAFHFSSNSFRTVQDAIGFTPQVLLEMPPNKMLDIHNKQYIVNMVTTVTQGKNTHTLIMNSTHYIQKMEMSARMQSRQDGLTAKYHFSDIVAVDKSSVLLIQSAKKYAKSTGTILIRGETGTGKEVLASSIHNESPRRNGPFVAVNCATLPENLAESELFGYERGAFTGANSNGKKGLFELAHGGTIFLDEIGDISISLQTKLLRVLQEREIMRLGGTKVIPLDVRVIAATNQNIHEMMKQGKFREDLFYRLALLELRISPLRERQADIIPLFTNFLNRHMQREHLHLYWENISVFYPLLTYDWPGNIRELENLAERVVLLNDQLVLNSNLMISLMRDKGKTSSNSAITMPMNRDLRFVEANYIHLLLERFGGDRNALCEYLNISRPTLWRKLNYISDSSTDDVLS